MKGKHAKPYKAGGASKNGSYLGKDAGKCGASANKPRGGNCYEGGKKR